MKMPVFSAKNIFKSFGGNQVLDDFSIDFYSGEVHALIGVNGAGKSTLVKIMQGVYQHDRGVLELNGEPVKFSNPLEAMNAGIAMVFQELNLFGGMTVTENIMIGRMSGKYSFIDWDACHSEAGKFLETLGIDLDPREKVKNISLAKQQLVEIAKCIYQKPKIIFLDEPSSSLSQAEEAILYKLVKDMKANNIAVVLITHKMEEIYNLCDSITIMRDGCNVSNGPVNEYTLQEVTQHMLGKATEIYRKSTVTHGNYNIRIMEVSNLSVKGKLENISFNLHEGEILAFTGLVGSGKSEIARALFGVYGKTEGRILIKGKDAKIRQPIDAITNGIGYMPISRKEEGIIQNFNIRENITITVLDKLGFFIKKGKEVQICSDMMDEFNVTPRKPDRNISNLSGGNQQKVILTRWIASKKQVILLDEPTRGVDVGAKQEIYDNLKKLSSEGVGVIIFTAETEELLSSSDRILVMRNGRIIKELITAETSSEDILKYSIAGMT